MPLFKFPKHFLWGAATSAHQVEGDNRNDWSEWEKENAERLSEKSGGKYPPENFISGQAADHYNRFREDFDIAKSLGHNAHRFSIEWSRVEPEHGKFDEKAIEHYRQVVVALRERGIEPFVTLYHWTLPLWVRDQGGWENKKTINNFARYAEKVAASLNGVKFWIILNEPLVYAKASYLEGRWPPQKKNILRYIVVSRNLAKAHRKVYEIIHRGRKAELFVGIAHNMSAFENKTNNPINYVLKKFGERRKNFGFLNSISHQLDFIGFNYYSSYLVNFGFSKIKTKETTDLGWSIYPEGMYRVLTDLKKYNKPIYITENGLADARDIFRAKFIQAHIQSMARAMKEGVDVQGYLYWSLLDNFEWSDGFWPRFGLAAVEYSTMKRMIRPSAFEYKKIIEQNTIDIE